MCIYLSFLRVIIWRLVKYFITSSTVALNNQRKFVMQLKTKKERNLYSCEFQRLNKLVKWVARFLLRLALPLPEWVKIDNNTVSTRKNKPTTVIYIYIYIRYIFNSMKFRLWPLCFMEFFLYKTTIIKQLRKWNDSKIEKMQRTVAIL